MVEPVTTPRRVEWRTVGLIVACYSLWVVCLFWLTSLTLPLTILATAVVIGFHSSLTHEVLHGHPFRSQRLNEATMALPLSLMIPYNRFRDMHLAHHQDANLTDPYDDPETNYMDPACWSQLSRPCHWVLRANNTMLGRIVIGTAIGQTLFLRDEWRAGWTGDGAVRLAWALHLPGVIAVCALVLASPMPLWAYLVSAYIGLSLIRIRTFLEHRAHEKSRARTVIIEDRGPLAFLFLNNNLHVVHHMNPAAAWYELPGLYAAGKARYHRMNEAYIYRSYGEIFRKYLLRSKDPVPHPLWPNP
ncbi:MAG: fatty acid desaturase [Paracoccaceae bacterium]